MKKIMIIAALGMLFAGCSMSGGPGSGQIKDALLKDYRDGLQDRVDSMASLLGEKRAKEGIASAEGTADPEQMTISDFDAEDIRELENGDYTAKVIYVLHSGDRVKQDMTQRVTLTKLQDEWKVIAKEAL